MEPISAIVNFGGKLLDKFIADPQAKQEALLELEKLHQNGELAKMVNETEILKTDVDDRKSARSVKTKFNDFLAVIGLIGSSFILYKVLFNGLATGVSEMTAGIIIGMYASLTPQIFNFYFGSSSSSQSKTDAMASAIKK